MKQYHKNPRQMTSRQDADLRRWLREFGDLSGIVHDLNSDEIIGGNQRGRIFDVNQCEVELAEGPHEPDEQGTVAHGFITWDGARYAYRQVRWTDKQCEQANIVANKAGGDFDFDALANGFEYDDLLDWGFDAKELDISLWADEPEDDPGAQIDRAEELREKWGVETGQLWQLGEHRVICGDCTDKDVVERVMAGDKAQMCFTSPPYNAGISAQLSGNTSIDDNLYKDEYNDNQSQPDYLKLLEKFTFQAMMVCEYVFVNLQILAGNKRAFTEYLYMHREKLADIAIWDKGRAAPQQALRVMDSRFEFILVFSKDATRAIGTREFRGMVHNVYNGSPQKSNEYAAFHAATFPVDFPEHFISTFTNGSEMIYEPFLGTGTTLIACERLSRRCRGVEISPAYVAVTLERWAEMTGQEPELIG